jgi:hypothetical protein
MNTSLKNLFSIRDGQVHIYGQPIGRHETYPWLYCANDIHKALVKRAVRMAERSGKDVEKAKTRVTGKRPGHWISDNSRDTSWDNLVSRAGKKAYSAHVKASTLSMAATAAIEKPVSPSAAAIQTKPGRYGGTYLCEQLIIAYCEWTSPKFASHVRQLFLDFAHGKQELHEQLDKNHIRAKGTQSRQESKENWPDWKKWNSDHAASYIVTTGVITNEVLGKSKAKYMEEHGIGEPFRDNISVSTLDMITSAQTLTIQLGDQMNSSGQHEVNDVAMRAGKVVKELGRASSLAKLDKLLSVIREANLDEVEYD